MMTALHWDAEGLSKTLEAMMHRLRLDMPSQARTLRLLQVDWPDTRHVVRATGRFVTDGLVLTRMNRPLFHHALHEALIAYEDAVASVEGDRARIRAFFGVFMRWQVGALARVNLRAPSGAIWQPADGLPLLQWTALHGTDLRVEPRKDIQPTALCRVMTTYTFTDALRSVLWDVVESDLARGSECESPPWSS